MQNFIPSFMNTLNLLRRKIQAQVPLVLQKALKMQPSSRDYSSHLRP